MAKGLYLGDPTTGVAKKIKKLYVGDPSTGAARKVKKVYIGDPNTGIARLAWASSSSMYGKVAAVNFGQLALSNDYFLSWTNHYTDANMRCICFSEDRFFIGAVGKIMTFKDGVFTTVFNLTYSTQAVVGIIANKKTIVAWYSDTVIVSTDGGSTWTVNNMGIGGILYSRNLIFDGTRFLAVATNGYIYTSTNGLSWTSVETPVGSDYTQGLFYLNGKYFVTQLGNGNWKYSTDLVTWKTCANTIGETVDYNSSPYLDFINGVYTAAFINATNKPIGYSTDGDTWSIKAQNYPVGGLQWISVNCEDRILIVSSAFMATSGMSVWQTTNGIDYTKITQGSPENNPTTGRCVAYANE